MKQDKETKGEFSRRSFIKTTAVGVGATALTGLATTGVKADGSAVTWDEETDVIVVGTGVAGYGAAIEAFDAGASVIIFEKENWYGGNSLLAGGNMQFPANHIQKAAGIEDHVEWAYDDIMEMGEYRCVPELVNLFTEGSADTALWFEKLGLKWSPRVSQQAGCRVPRTLVPAASPNYPGARGISEIAVLHKAATDRKIPVRLEHKLTRVIRPDSKGPVLGIEVVAGDKTLNIKARKAVILATGGFKANHQMLRSWDPQLDEAWTWSGYPYTHTTGDAHLAIQAIGGGVTDMSFVCEFNFTIGSTRYVVWDPPSMSTIPTSGGLPLGSALPRIILVENEGRRYADESKFVTGHVVLNGPHTIAYLNLPKRPRKSFAIADADSAAALNWKLDQFKNPNLNVAPYLNPEYVATANTIAELATQLGIPVANLEETVAKYNGFVAAGADPDFNRPGPLFTITKPPFFAARLAFGTHDQCAGVRVNSRLQVLEQMQQFDAGSGPSVSIDQEQVIPHLYAPGEIAGGTFGADRGSGKMGSYLVQGRVAGKLAAAESPIV